MSFAKPSTSTAEELSNTEFEISEDVEVIDQFENMGLREELMRGIRAYGLEKPSAIQQRVIKPIMNGRDLVAQAQFGTDKIAAFAIAVLQSLDLAVQEVQVLFLVPTDELAMEAQKIILALGSFMNIQCYCCVGGINLEEDMTNLDYGYHIVSGTPGRVNDLINRHVLRTRAVRILVLDEVDEMINKGFKAQIFDMYRSLPPSTQMILISSTLPQEVLEIEFKYMTDAIRILAKRDELTLDGIKQFFIIVEREEWKLGTLCDLYDTLAITKAVIYCNSKCKVNWLAEKMREINFTVTLMHGDMPKRERDNVMMQFRSGQIPVLISTDIWARDIDVHQVSCIINYDLPISPELYIHRLSCLDRIAPKNAVINFVKSDDIENLKDIEQYYSTQINELPLDITNLI